MFASQALRDEAQAGRMKRVSEGLHVTTAFDRSVDHGDTECASTGRRIGVASGRDQSSDASGQRFGLPPTRMG
jgi:hypothetical protein